MSLSLEHVAGLCAQMPPYGRLRVDWEAGLLVFERTMQAKDLADLVDALGRREQGETLTVQRYPAHWLITYAKTLATATVQ